MSEGKLKVALVGDATTHALLSFYFRAFKQLNSDVKIIDMRNFYKMSFLNRVANWFLRMPVYWGMKRLNLFVIKEVLEFSPDMVLFVKPFFVIPKTLLEIKNKNRIIFSFFQDNLLNQKSISSNFLKSLPLYDCHFFANSGNEKDFQAAGAKRTVILPFAADPEVFYPIETDETKRKQLGADIVFVGNYEEERASILERLCRLGYNIKIYGNRWNKAWQCFCLIRKKSIMYRPVFAEEMSGVFNSSKIALAFLRKSNKDKQTTRTYEITACGGFMLHERTDEAMVLFEEGKEAEFFGSFGELKNKIDFYLKNDTLREKIALNGYKKISSNVDYTYIARAKVVLEEYYRLKNTNAFLQE